MEAVVGTTDNLKVNSAMETIYSYLDKGIDDMEEGRLYTADEAFRIIRERMNNEL